MARLILDTGLLIANARGKLDLSLIAAGDDLALPAVVIAEYREGVLRTVDERRRSAHRAFLDEMLELTPVVDYTAEVAEHHAELLAHARTAGVHRGAHDLIIAASARATNRVLLTRDARARFDELPGVDARVVAIP
ncbi:MAG: PIN domain-containing protein [Pseudonocardia sp.]